jgi:1,4-alpha-glucan branching enzyme
MKEGTPMAQESSKNIGKSKSPDLATPETPVAPVKKKAISKALADHLYYFHEGNDTKAFQFLGAHPETQGKKEGWVFRVWAPDAKEVGVMGDFNEWQQFKNPMTKISVGVWETFIPGLTEFSSYKYAIKTRFGNVNEKADPYAFHAETRPLTASKLVNLDGYEWGDTEYINNRKSALNAPLNIYELHLGSWRRTLENGMLSYHDIARELTDYVLEMGYTHVELLPIMEHPFDKSWGYQVTGYFAPTSRFGTPKDFMFLVDTLHKAGIGVILDWVPAHFPKDGFGLIEFDGNYQYEYSDPSRREHTDWGTRIFDYGRNEVRSFLMSSALFWLEQYHADGLRVDAVASMLYLDYGNKKNYVPNVYGGRENLEAVNLLQKLNEQVYAAFPHTLMIAEESTAWPMVTKPTYMGGLGFNFKWNMGWMNDTLHYIKQDPIFRQYNHNDLTFSMMYAFSENYVLPVSHDEVVHLKCSLISKMPGYYVDKFAGVRVYLGYMIAHPGKKLNFMGNEIGQFSEWSEEHSLDWHLLDFDSHRSLQHYVQTLNGLYRNNPSFWELDTSWEGFRWINVGDYQGNTLAFGRVAKDGSEVQCLFNFSPVPHNGYRVGVPTPGAYRELLDSNATDFGGWGKVNDYLMYTDEVETGGFPYSFLIDLPPYSAVFTTEFKGGEND